VAALACQSWPVCGVCTQEEWARREVELRASNAAAQAQAQARLERDAERQVRGGPPPPPPPRC
jgi:hypothetical protein